MANEMRDLLTALFLGQPVDRRSKIYEAAGVADYRHNDRLLAAGFKALAAAYLGDSAT